MQPDKLQHHRRHRKRRFHRPREALGFGYNDYVAAPLLNAARAQPESASAEPEVSLETEDYDQALIRVLCTCGWALLGVIFLYCTIYNWVASDPHTGHDWPPGATTRAR